MNINISAIVGSLREGSYNKKLADATKEFLPEGVNLNILTLHKIEPFNADKEETLSEPVKKLKEEVEKTDAVLFVTPEYNYSVPGVLKNAIDWITRPPGTSGLKGKPVAIMGATTGRMGTSRAQFHLRQILVHEDTKTMAKPQMMVSRARDKFDDSGNLVDKDTRERLQKFLNAFKDWVLLFE